MLTAVNDPETADDRRTATRHPAAAVPFVTGVRLSPMGTDVHLVNISTTGALVRSTTRLMPGTVVTVLFDGTFAPLPVKATVVRGLVADICRPTGLCYHVGLAFQQPIRLEQGLADVRTTPAAMPAPEAPAAIDVPVLVNRW